MYNFSEQHDYHTYKKSIALFVLYLPPSRARVEQDETAKRGGTDEVLYLDRILDSAAEGAVSLLRELPREHLGSLRLMLNQPVPSRARLDIWRLLLKHTAVRERSALCFPTRLTFSAR